MSFYGEVEEALHDARILKFRWRVPDYSFHENSELYSPKVKYLGVTWELMMQIFPSYHQVWLLRNQPTSVHRGPVRCSFGYMDMDGSEEFVVRERVLTEKKCHLSFGVEPRRYVEHPDELTITCMMWNDESAHEEVVSRIAQRRGASSAGCGAHGRPSKGVSSSTQTDDASSTDCRIHEDRSKGVSRETQTENGGARSDERHSKDVEELRRKFRLWLQQPQEGDRIRILRPEHFQEHTPEGGPPPPRGGGKGKDDDSPLRFARQGEKTVMEVV